MAEIRPFQALRPVPEAAEETASLPYDVFTSAEARKRVKENPRSFLRIDRPETMFPEGTDMYGKEVYEKARDTLEEMKQEGILIRDDRPCFYIYALTMDDRTQTGLVCCASVEDYQKGVIKKHENTREKKEQDRIRHVDTCGAHTGPIFLAYRSNAAIRAKIREAVQQTPVYDFVKPDGVRHQVWKVEEEEWIREVQELFRKQENLYIADGHHRAASAVKAGLKRRQETENLTGEEEFLYFLSVLFPQEELKIFDYNRIVHRLNGEAPEEICRKLKRAFVIEKRGQEIFTPERKGEMGMYLGGCWYRLEVKEQFCSDDPIAGLDVSILEREVLQPVFGITDSRTDPRMEYVGGIRGLQILQDTVDRDGDGAAFSMYPTSMEELLQAADHDRLMPPKSTWFEPKLLSGLFIHEF